MRLLVCGGQNFRDVKRLRTWMFECCDLWVAKNPHVYTRRFNAPHIPHLRWVTVIHGAAPGADTVAGLIAKQCGMKVEEYPADWDRYGKAAGPIRNTEMLYRSNPDFVLAAPGGRGTNDMCSKAVKAGFTVIDKRNV